MPKRKIDIKARLRAAKEPAEPLDYRKMPTWEVRQCITYLETKVLALEIPEVAAWVRDRLAEANRVLEMRGEKNLAE